MQKKHSNYAREIRAEIIERNDLTNRHPDHFLLTLNAPWVAKNAAPGQFVHVLPPSGEPMLRRPLSIMSADSKTGKIRLLFRVVGEGTRLIASQKEGSELDIIGPLGNGFPIPPEITENESSSVILIGGGVGIPPLVYLAEKLVSLDFSEDLSEKRLISVLLGARDRETLICIDEFEEIGLNPELATEDGSIGHEGFITPLLLSPILATSPNTIVYACGPIPMLRSAAENSKIMGFKCFVSLENKLGCGIGACLGCSIPVRTEGGEIRYERICYDGPVFDSVRVAFDLM